MKNTILNIFLLLFSSEIFSQNVSVSGKVLFAGDSTFIIGSEIYCDKNKVAVTDSKGEYVFQTNKGKHQIVIRKQGFKAFAIKLQVDSSVVYPPIYLDSLTIQMNEVLVVANKDNSFGITKLKQVEGTSIYAGKKTEVIVLEDANANLATNNARQVFSKVAGLNVWESDGAGMQLGIGGRGLSPNRVSNFNTRQNGYDISADALGYPESYYTPPMDALERIEVVRGAASLQYGTQFGGFINFKFKTPSQKTIQLEAKQTLGSYNFYNAFTTISGTKNKISYYVFHQYKKGDGWRENSKFNLNVAHASVGYMPSTKIKITTEYTFMDYIAQQPGGLTDKQFEDNPQKSYRNRNWFKVNWNLAAVLFNYKINDFTTVDCKVFGLYAQRDALGFLGMINRVDPMTERDLLQDKFRNYGAEARYLNQYKLFNNRSAFLIGARYYHGKTYRKQGFANADSTGNKSDFKYLNPSDLEHSDYLFPSENISFFSENIFRITPKLNITPGVRYEYISTNSEGYYNEQYSNLAGDIIFKQKNYDNRTNNRSFVLLGIGLGYRINNSIEFYSNISQNYRSINFNDMRIVNPNSRVDENLKDEDGYSADIGFRGNVKELVYFDVSAFYLKYNNRIGSVLQLDSSTYQLYRFRTNISDSRNLGVESMIEADIFKLIFGKEKKLGVSLFSNFSILDAKYINSKQVAFENKKVELVPDYIFRSGVTVSYKSFKISYQYSYTSEQFTDATNAKYTANAVNGIIPAYFVSDFSLNYSYKRFLFSGQINNLLNEMYFTRRADGYPGPGIIPSDGRSFFITVGIKI